MTLLKAFAAVSGMTFLSRLFGLARDVTLAAVFGATVAADAFFAAFRLPNTLRRFTAEGALTQAFVPAYAQAQKEGDRQAAKLAGETAASLGLLLLFISVLCMIAAPWIIAAIAPGLPDKPLASDLLRIVFPYILFISLVALAAGMLNTQGKFRAAAAAPILLNISIITASLWVAPHFTRPVFALAWAVFIGGALQLLWILCHLRRAGLWPDIRLCLSPSPAARRMLCLMAQSALAAGATQINLLINLAIASFLVAGSISWLHYADRLMELPAGLLGAALATVALPALAKSSPDKQSDIIDGALRLALFLAAPAAVGLALFADPLVEVLFKRGAFDSDDAQMTSRAVIAYSAGIIGLVTTRPLVAFYFSRRDAATPVKMALLALLATQIMNGIFIFGLELAHAGLALSVGLAACLNALTLLIILRRRDWYRPRLGWAAFSLRVLAALVVLAAFLLFATPSAGFWQTATLGIKIGALLAYVFGAAAIYFTAAYLLGLRSDNFRTKIFSD